ncbi:MAG: enterochelin esterase-like enzyme [Glaciecola sp.]|jgi:enterochelin esterase-like enzyme
MMRHKRIAVLLIGVIAATLTPMGSQAQAAPFGLVLEGEYRMILEDDLAFAEPAFDDSSWETTTVPTSDGHEGKYDSYNGFGWFRRSFVLPAEADGLNLVLSAGFLDDADEAYLNGTLIGKSGEFPPNADSQWFERRLYPIPAAALRYGAENVLAVRINDVDGGGGWYKGPVGVFSKERLREEVYGISSAQASDSVQASVLGTLASQAQALASGDLDAYVATLDSSFFHDGDDVDRRRVDLARWLGTYDSLELIDGEVEVIVTADGTVLADSNRSLHGIKGADRIELRAPTQDFLRFDGTSGREIGNRSRFFRDSVDSTLEGQPREFVVYLPPSYFENPDHRYPTIYKLHGINGGAREWEPREFDKLLDELFTTGGLAESIVVFPDGESLWYTDSATTPWRSMFSDEMMPLVDAEYRTLDQREFRGVGGVSMGGYGSFVIGWGFPERFSSIHSHMGAINTPFGGAANAGETPTVQATTQTPEFLSSYRYFLDVCEGDALRGATEQMSATLTAKLVEHTAVVYPEGAHNDACWLPHIDASFGMHSDNFRTNGLAEPAVAPAEPSEPVSGPAPDPEASASDAAAAESSSSPGSLPATGGGAVLAGLALLTTTVLTLRRHPSAKVQGTR